MTPRHLVPGLLLGLVVLDCSPVSALNVTFDANGRLAEEFNTNIFLTPRPHTDAWGQGLDGGMTLTGIERDWKSAVSANFQNRWYVTDRNLDYFNQFFSWKNSYFTDRSKFALDLQYNNDTTLTSLADLVSSLGYVFERVPRTDRIVSPQWNFAVTPRTMLNVGYNYRDSTYEHSLFDDGRGSNLFPNTRSHLASFDLSHDWSPRLKLMASSYYSYYELNYPARITVGSVPVPIFPGFVVPFPGIIYSPSITSDIQTANLMLGFKYLLTETVDINASAGAQHNQTHRPASTLLTRIELADGSQQRGPDIPSQRLSSDSFTQIFALSANKRLQSGTVGVQYSRSISPNLLGDLITYDRVALFGQHQFTSRLTTSLNLSYYDQTFPAGNSRTNNIPVSQKVTRYGLESQWNWFFEENWSLNAAYRFFYQEFQLTTNQAATSHGIYFYILHTFDQQRL